MSSRHRTVNSLSLTPLEKENDDENNKTENRSETRPGETSIETDTNLTEKTQQHLCKSQTLLL